MSTILRPLACERSARRLRWRSVLATFTFGYVSLLIAGCESDSMTAPVVELHGAGSAFPTPLYRLWLAEVSQQQPNLSIDYDEIGSGAGVQRFTDELVDYAASDAPLSEEEIAQVDRGVRQFPMTSGAIVLVYNLLDQNGDPIPNLRLSRGALAGIFLGEIRSWQDKEITRHNPKVAFPDLPIQVEYRLDSSGSTTALTRHLSAISQQWKEGPGIGKTVIWPTGAGMPKDVGVARGVGQVLGSIGYVSYGFARQAKLPMATLENKAGSFVAPNLKSMQLGLSAAQGSLSETKTAAIDPAAEGAYPIVTFSWLHCYEVYENPDKLNTLKKLIRYGLQDGQQFSEKLGYVPLSNAIVQDALEVLDSTTLPESAGAATSLPVSEPKTAPDPIAQAVIEAVSGAKPASSEKRPKAKPRSEKLSQPAVPDAAAQESSAGDDAENASAAEPQKSGEF
jgi:phosphate transport system substrate-binding protein